MINWHMTVHMEYVRRFHTKWSASHQTANAELDVAVNSLLNVTLFRPAILDHSLTHGLNCGLN